jgi:Domain of unknown function (DUF3859)
MNTHILAIFSIFSSMVLCGCASENARSYAPTGSIIEYGLCVTDGQEVVYEHKESTAGYASTVDMSITRQTLTIPLKKDIAFGYTWLAMGLPKNAEITFAISHPEITKPDDTLISSFNETLILHPVNGKLESTDCYTLSEEHEMVAGDWTIAVKHKNKLLATKKFQVVQD